MHLFVSRETPCPTCECAHVRVYVFFRVRVRVFLCARVVSAEVSTCGQKLITSTHHAD